MEFHLVKWDEIRLGWVGMRLLNKLGLGSNPWDSLGWDEISRDDSFS